MWGKKTSENNKRPFSLALSLTQAIFFQKNIRFVFFWTPQRAQVEGDLVRRRRSIRRGVKVGELRREEAAAVSLEEEPRVVYKVRRKYKYNDKTVRNPESE